jgi:predicted DNA-binding protein with PD1-like motif
MKYLTQEPIKMHLIRLYKGEDIIESLQKFCQQNPDIGAGTIRGIGAVSEAKVGFFNGKEYVENTFSENLEILSLQGNIAENQVVHLHGVFGKLDGSCVGGHIFPGCIVSVTCEIQIFVAEPSVTRQEDPITKLNLLELPHEIE